MSDRYCNKKHYIYLFKSIGTYILVYDTFIRLDTIDQLTGLMETSYLIFNEKRVGVFTWKSSPVVHVHV